MLHAHRCRSQDESRLSMHVKDSMREHSITAIANAWYQLTDVYKVRESIVT